MAAEKATGTSDHLHTTEGDEDRIRGTGAKFCHMK